MIKVISHRLESVAVIVDKKTTKACHPGLLLEKLLPGVVDAKNSTPDKSDLPRIRQHYIPDVLDCRSDTAFYQKLKSRHDLMIVSLTDRVWQMKLCSSMAMHLARAALLENANVCLHRTYGFAYLPGSGLKGMARAWAETAWLPDQKDRTAAHKEIERVFGWGDTPWRKELLKDYPGIVQKDAQGNTIVDHGGTVVFHDAWPTSWPELQVDILACHHGDYYQNKDKKNPPPGDWESPNLVNFLVVKKGAEFSFAVSKAFSHTTDDDVKLASEWLTGALTHAGAGAKTNAGYGAFVPVEGSAPAMPTKLQKRSYTCELELVTPAFLAGAQQGVDDCELRGATLRGQLRWWWRTMHAAHMSTAQLRALEEVIWGSASKGGAVKLNLVSLDQEQHSVNMYSKGLAVDDAAKTVEIGFRREHYQEVISTGIEAGNGMQRLIDGGKVVHGLIYASFGMFAMRDRKDRPYLRHGAKWSLSISASDGYAQVSVRENGRELKKQVKVLDNGYVLNEAMNALWLLTKFGGVGSKSRKGFGSLCMTNTGAQHVSLETCKADAVTTRSQFIKSRHFGQIGNQCANTAALENMITFETAIELPFSSRYQILQQVGFSLALFSAMKAHKAEKKALGLPRVLKGRADKEFAPTPPVTNRHASPWHIHIAKGHNDGLEVRYSAFPSAWLPDLATSKRWLEALRNHLASDLALRADHINKVEKDFEISNPAAKRPSAANMIVKCKLQEEKTKSGKLRASWCDNVEFVQHVDGTPPPGQSTEPGTYVELVYTGSSFRWPTEKDRQPTAKSKGKMGRQGRRP